MDHGRVFLAVLLFCGAITMAALWPLWVQQARAPAQEILRRQGFALTAEERAAVEAFAEQFYG